MTLFGYVILRGIKTVFLELLISPFGGSLAHVGRSNRRSVPSTIPALSNKDVIGLVKLGLSTEIVIAKVKQSSCGYDTSPTALAELKSAGVPDAVGIAMIKAPCNPEVRSARAVDQGVRELYEVKRIFVDDMGKFDDANRFRLLSIIAIERPNERAY